MDQRIAANSRSAIFAGLRSLGTNKVAKLLNCSESTVSELSSDAKYKLNFDNFADVLNAMGLKVVPAQNRCLNPKKLEAIMMMAQIGMERLSSSELYEDAD